MWFGVKQQCLCITKSRCGLTYRVSMMQNSSRRWGCRRMLELCSQQPCVLTQLQAAMNSLGLTNYLGACPWKTYGMEEQFKMSGSWRAGREEGTELHYSVPLLICQSDKSSIRGQRKTRSVSLMLFFYMEENRIGRKRFFLQTCLAHSKHSKF